MSNKLNNIFSETSCLSPGILADYTGNKLSKEDKFLVEKHLTDCELCSDALEGLSFVKNKSRLQKIILNINKLIDTRTNKKAGRIIHFDFRVKLAAAAILICVLGITILFKYLLNEPKSEMIALRTEKETQYPMEETKSLERNTDKFDKQNKNSGSDVSEENEQTLFAEDAEYMTNEVKEKDIPPVAKNVDISLKGTAVAEKNVTADYFWSHHKDEDLSKKENRNLKANEESVEILTPATANYTTMPGIKGLTDSFIVYDGKVKTENATVMNKVSNVSSQLTLAETQTKLKSSKKAESNYKSVAGGVTTTSTDAVADNSVVVNDPQYALAIKKYDSLDYLGSKDLLESYLKTHPNDDNANYYYAASNYFLQKHEEAIKYFKKVMKNKNSAFYKISQWYLALSYLGIEDDANAGKILNEIVDSGGSFKTQAEEKLLEIKK